jgi:hypothetical protein
MPVDLTDCSVEELMAEVQRRLDCQKKPEKRVILIGVRSTKLTISPKTSMNCHKGSLILCFCIRPCGIAKHHLVRDPVGVGGASSPASPRNQPGCALPPTTCAQNIIEMRWWTIPLPKRAN